MPSVWKYANHAIISINCDNATYVIVLWMQRHDLKTHIAHCVSGNHLYEGMAFIVIPRAKGKAWFVTNFAAAEMRISANANAI